MNVHTFSKKALSKVNERPFFQIVISKKIKKGIKTNAARRRHIRRKGIFIMKKEINDLTGRKFGRLTVLERGTNDNSRGTNGGANVNVETRF